MTAGIAAIATAFQNALREFMKGIMRLPFNLVEQIVVPHFISTEAVIKEHHAFDESLEACYAQRRADASALPG
jgi:hypothetical protein